ncbi:MAG: caspase family protein [Fimbriimonadaceae bacterium]|nr:caspase family protein [Fimbriimonadaceae bacterium]
MSRAIRGRFEIALGRVAVALVLTFLSAIGSAQLGRSWALVIGVESFESDAVSPVPNAVADARVVAETLVRNGFAPDHVITMTSDGGDSLRPTNVNVIEQIEKLATVVQPEDAFFFYYVGHGITREGRHFLATTNTRLSTPGTVEISALSLDSLGAALKNVIAQRAVYCIDAFKGSPDKNRELLDNPLTPSFLQAIMGMARGTALGNAGVGVLLANSINERSYNAPLRGHSAFAWFVAEALGGKAFAQGESMDFAAFAAWVQAGVRTWSDENLTVRSRTQVPLFQIVGTGRVTFGTSTGGGGPITPLNPDPGRTNPPTNNLVRVSFSTTPPGARITVNDVEIGGKTTPFEFDLNLGTDLTQDITVVATLEGYERVEQVLTVRRGQPAEVALTLRKAGTNPPANPNPNPNVGASAFLARKVNVGDTYAFNYRSDSKAQGVTIQVQATDTHKVTRVAPDGSFTVESTITDAKLRLNNQEIAQESQPPTTVTFAPNGVVQSVQSAQITGTALRFAMMTMFVAPGKEVKRGDKWEHSIAADAQRGLVDATIQYQVDRLEKVNGVEAYKIRFNYREKVGAKPTQVTGFVWISATDGWLLKSDLDIKGAPSDAGSGSIDISLLIERKLP